MIGSLQRFVGAILAVFTFQHEVWSGRTSVRETKERAM